MLKALLILGDMQDQLEASMVLGLIAEQEPDDEPEVVDNGTDKTVEETDESRSTPRVVRKRSSNR